jgi:hypothetical protein
MFLIDMSFLLVGVVTKSLNAVGDATGKCNTAAKHVECARDRN